MGDHIQRGNVGGHHADALHSLAHRLPCQLDAVDHRLDLVRCGRRTVHADDFMAIIPTAFMAMILVGAKDDVLGPRGMGAH